MKFGCNLPSSFRGEVDRRRTTDDRQRTTDGRTTEPAYTISSPGAFGSGELKNSKRNCFSYLGRGSSKQHSYEV